MIGGATSSAAPERINPGEGPVRRGADGPAGVGRMVELESWRENGPSNISAWFGINEVSQMYVYDDIEDARKAYYTDGL